jgi:dihydroorotate dehydrogenase
MLAGAAAVSLGSAIFQDPARAIRIVEGLPEAIGRAHASCAKELTGGMRLQGET